MCSLSTAAAAAAAEAVFFSACLLRLRCVSLLEVCECVWVCVANSCVSGPVIAAGQTQRQQKPSVPPLLSITFQITGRSHPPTVPSAPPLFPHSSLFHPTDSRPPISSPPLSIHSISPSIVLSFYLFFSLCSFPVSPPSLLAFPPLWPGLMFFVFFFCLYLFVIQGEDVKNLYKKNI